MYKIYVNNIGVLNRYVIRLLLIMQLTIVILIVGLLQVSASAVAQKFTYSKKDASLYQVFEEVRKQTGYNIIWNEDEINANKTIDASFKKSSIVDVLNVCKNKYPFTYAIDGKMVILKPGKEGESLAEKLLAFFKAIEVRGRILNEDNTPLVGATIKVKATGNAVETNVRGEFALKGVDEDAVLVISYIGYESIEVKAKADLGLIKLYLSSDKLKEVQINAGYYTVKERELTGSITKIKASTIEKQPVNNVMQALQNRVTGLEITQLSGVPGGGFKVQIRGRSSIQNGTEPLYIVDGVIYSSSKLNTASSNTITQDASPLSMINPNDIESIDVLKDADATAIYGSRGANGVILITTKKGGVGLIKVNAGISQGVGQVGNRLDLMNTEQYIAMRMEAFKNDGLNPGSADYDLNGSWDKNKYTDWQDVLIGGRANITNAFVSASGGTSNSSYLVSGNYYSEGTVFPGSFGFKRGGVHTSINFGSSESKLNAAFTGSYTRTVNKLTPTDPTSNILLAPNHPDLYDESGKIRWSNNGVAFSINPMATLLNTTDAITDNLIGNVNLSYKILKDLTLKASLGYTTTKRDELYKSPLTAQNPSTNPSAATRQSRFGNNYNNSWIIEPQLNYNVDLGPGTLIALVGMSFQKNATQYRDIQATNFNSDELMENIASASVFRILESTFATYKYAAVFSRINYSVANKYFLNLTGRRDASSRFGPERQFANFGAIGAAWVLSEEEFFKNSLPFLSFGKLRASYGITGNDQVSDYQFLQLYTSGAAYQGTSTSITSRIANPDFGWETNKKGEVALQLGFFKDRINVQIAHFRNRSSNQLVANLLPPSVGATSLIANLPAKVQNAGWEFEGNFKLFNRKDWDWILGLNVTIPKNKLLAYPDLATSANRTTYLIGESLNIRRYYNTYVDPQTGLYAFEDRDGNKVQSEADIYLSKFIGQFYYGGLQNSVRYKQLSLDFLISFTKQNGNSYLNGLPGVPPGYFERGLPTNQPLAVLDRWQQAGDQTNVSKFSTLSSGFTNFSLGTNVRAAASIADDSFIRLKNIALNYSLPQNWISSLNISQLQFSLQGQNLFTITNYEGLDPENQLINRLPPLRVLSLGLKLTL